ncbi:MAG: glycosyltransferase family 2 protein [Chloroflexi bacterium]|nr:MAG: glycosyltransferase family 2 protein [Chloroflexota bacterium]
MKQRISIVMPACNEEEALRLLPARLFPVLEAMQDAYELELVLVDDGSSDATFVEMERLRDSSPPFPIVLGVHPVNRGLGAALRTGSDLATGQIIVWLDADGTYPFSLVESLVEAVERGADVATASPYHPQGGVEGVPAFRLLFSRGASTLYRMLVDYRVNTWTAMVRAWRADVLRSASTDEDGFLYVAMTLVEARRRGARIVEAPAVLARRQVGVSKAKVWRITKAHLRYMRGLARLRLTGKFWLREQPSGAGALQHG